MAPFKDIRNSAKIPPQEILPGDHSILEGMTAENHVKTLNLEQLNQDLLDCKNMVKDLNHQCKGFRKIQKIIEDEINSRKDNKNGK